jgi:hypothetical protein
MIDWLNANTGLLNVVFTMVVALSTVVYAVLTAKLVGETRRMRRAQTNPQLAIHATSSEFGLNFMTLVVRNVGPAAAHDVNLKLNRDIEWMRGKKLSERGLFKYPIPYLAPGQEISTFLLNVLDHVRDDKRTIDHLSFTIAATYRNSTGDRFNEDFPVHFEYLEELIGIGTPPLVTIARDLDDIKKSLASVVAGRSTLRAVVKTIDEERLENEAMRRRIENRQAAQSEGESAS